MENYFILAMEDTRGLLNSFDDFEDTRFVDYFRITETIRYAKKIYCEKKGRVGECWIDVMNKEFVEFTTVLFTEMLNMDRKSLLYKLFKYLTRSYDNKEKKETTLEFLERCYNSWEYLQRAGSMDMLMINAYLIAAKNAYCDEKNWDHGEFVDVTDNEFSWFFIEYIRKHVIANDVKFFVRGLKQI